MPLRSENNGYGLLIGDDFRTGKPQYYFGERGLVTIAAPGSGKTQAHILPNLLTWKGPAIVLDVTGDLWRKTSDRRSQFGPVYKIDTGDPRASDHYNPFSLLDGDPDSAWSAAETLGHLIYSRAPEGGGGSAGGFFNEAAPDYLSALACFIALNEPPHRRNCATLLRYVADTAISGFLEYAKDSDIVGLEAMAATLSGADKDTLANVKYTAKNSLRPWTDPAIGEITRVSDWHPAMIRKHNATLYICMSLDSVQKHPALVRVIVGQHLREMMRYEIDRDRTPWIQIFLDEAPQLRNMQILTQAIEAGRNYNLRMWMVMQWRGQLVTAYGQETADGMIAACGLQAYMNPSTKDGMAQKLSEDIGVRRSPFADNRRPIHEAQALAGPAFQDDVIAFDHGAFVRLRKHFQGNDKKLKAMEGAAA